MKIRLLNKNETDRINILAGQYGSVFNTQEWLDIFGNRIYRYVITDHDDQIIGGFYLYLDRLLGFRLIKNPPFTPSCGLFYIPVAKNKAKKLSFEKGVVTGLAAFLKSYPGIKILSFPAEIRDMQPFYWQGFKVIPNYTYQLDLRLSQDQIFESFSPERRNDIKKAQKNGLVTRLNSDLREVRQLVLMTLQRQSRKIPLEILDIILFRFANPGNSFTISVIDSGNKVIAGVFCVYDSRRVYYLLSGFDSGNRNSGGVALALWEAILRGKQLGAGIFDFEGSMIPQVERFFRDFGGELIPYFTVNKAWLPLEILLKLIRRNRF